MFKTLEIKRGLADIEPLLNSFDILYGNAFICGGYARYCLSPDNNPIKAYDIDIYCKNENAFTNLKSFFFSEGFTIRNDNAVALTYHKQKGNKWDNVPIIQLIKPFMRERTVTKGTVEEILSNFDFTVIRCALIYKGWWMGLVDEDFEKDEIDKNLRIKNIHCPISSLLRFMKYGKKGYHTRPMQILSLFIDWDNRPQEYRNTLEEKLNIITKGDILTDEEIAQLEVLLRID